MAVWLKERNPGNLDELGKLVDKYALARQGEKGKLKRTGEGEARTLKE